MTKKKQVKRQSNKRVQRVPVSPDRQPRLIPDDPQLLATEKQPEHATEGRRRKTPVTDALGLVASDIELAELIVEAARDGKPAGLRLWAQYRQTPEMLNRLSGEIENTPIQFVIRQIDKRIATDKTDDNG